MSAVHFQKGTYLFFFIACVLVVCVNDSNAEVVSSYKPRKNEKNIVLPEKVDAGTENGTVYTDKHGFKHHKGKFHPVNSKQKKELERLEKFRRRRKQAPMVFLLLLTIMVCGQIALFTWRKAHYRSYQQVTLLGMWLFPIIFSSYFRFWRFISVWLFFTASTGYYCSLALGVPLDVKAPRLVYTWFYNLYRLCYSMGVLGYVAILIEIFGIREALFLPKSMSMYATLLLFYGLYFGVLGRDFAELCSWRMNQAMGYSKKDDDEPQRLLPRHICALCAVKLRPDVEELIEGQYFANDDVSNAEQRSLTREERVVKLKCGHEFHEFCLRGWLIVGKHSKCPNCGEKVDIRSVLGMTPWESQGLLWAQLLDALRYLIVWNPIIFMLTQGTLYEFGF